MSEQSVTLAELKSEVDELRSEVKVLQEAKSNLTSELSNSEQVNQTLEGYVCVRETFLSPQSTLLCVCTCVCVYREKQKLASLRESYGQLQRSYQHMEKDMGRRKEREAELLTLTEKLSSTNAELQTARSSWESKVRGRGGDLATHIVITLFLNRRSPSPRRSQYKGHPSRRH